VQQAEAAVAAAERSAAAAALNEEAAVREVQGLQQRIRVMEESAKFKQQIAKQAASAAEPSKLRTDLVLSQQQVQRLEGQLGEREAALQEALAEAKQLRGAEEAAQEGQREQREAASQAARQLGKKDAEAQVLRSQLAAAKLQCQQLESSVSKHEAETAAAMQRQAAELARLQHELSFARQERQRQEQQLEEQPRQASLTVAAGNSNGAAPASGGGSGRRGGGGCMHADVASLQQQLAKRDKKLEIMTRVLKADSEVRSVVSSPAINSATACPSWLQVSWLHSW
jgi:DNA repair exonuclease SbcCD ATPase subunit